MGARVRVMVRGEERRPLESGDSGPGVLYTGLSCSVHNQVRFSVSLDVVSMLLLTFTISDIKMTESNIKCSFPFLIAHTNRPEAKLFFGTVVKYSEH